MANKMREWSASERKSAQTSAKAWQDFFVKGGATQQTELEALGRVVEVRQLHEAELLALDGVVGVAESYKVKAGKPKCSILDWRSWPTINRRRRPRRCR